MPAVCHQILHLFIAYFLQKSVNFRQIMHVTIATTRVSFFLNISIISIIIIIKDIYIAQVRKGHKCASALSAEHRLTSA